MNIFSFGLDSPVKQNTRKSCFKYFSIWLKKKKENIHTLTQVSSQQII